METYISWLPLASHLGFHMGFHSVIGHSLDSDSSVGKFSEFYMMGLKWGPWTNLT